MWKSADYQWFLTQAVITYRGQPQLQIQTWDILLCFWLPLSRWTGVDPACDRHDILYWKPFCLDRWQSCPTQDDVSESFPCFQIPSAEQVWLPFFPKNFTDLTTEREKEKERKKRDAHSFYLMRGILPFVPKQISPKIKRQTDTNWSMQICELQNRK